MKRPPQSSESGEETERERALSKKKISSSEATFQSVLGKVAAVASYSVSQSARQPTDRLT